MGALGGVPLTNPFNYVLSSCNFIKYVQLYYSATNSMGPLSRIFSFFTLYVHSVSHTVPQNLATSVYQSPISTSFTRETSVLCLYFPLLTMVQKFSSFQSLSCVQLFATLWITACRALCPSATPGVHPTHVHWVGDAIQPSYLCRPLLCLPSIFPSIRVFSNESALRIRWPK